MFGVSRDQITGFRDVSNPSGFSGWQWGKTDPATPSDPSHGRVHRSRESIRILLIETLTSVNSCSEPMRRLPYGKVGIILAVQLTLGNSSIGNGEGISDGWQGG